MPARWGRFFCRIRKKSIFVFLFVISIVVLSYLFLPRAVFAQTSTPPPLPSTNTATWEFDPIVTEVGKNADRARQLLWWVFQHPGIHTAPVLAQIWAIARNIVYVFIVLVIVAFGISLILGRRRGAVGPIFSGITSPVFGVNVPTIFIKIGALLLYVTFSYIIIVAMIQTSDIIMRFFIETVGGKDLFNIIFSGAGNNEANYITFVGYKDVNPLSLEMANTSLLFIKLTSFTYNVMSSILILRTIILWFLLIIAPFLAILMPFVFIRNTGWIWIGVFFQWLFYGPIFALFLASLTRIWVAGIPFPFDFSRVNKPAGQVYRTAINILWGGPAQTLSPGNSANYVDTYAEYFIALIMLWAAIILPWLLLRIFRDYCCSMIAASANTLNSIFDRLRQYPPPPPPAPVAPTTSGIAVELPFRQKVEEKVKEVSQVRIEEIKDVSKLSSNEIVRSMDMSVSKLSDVSRLETNTLKRQEVTSYLNKISQPESIASTQEREKYMLVKKELAERALKGDKVAQTLMAASTRQTQVLARQVLTQARAVPVQGAVPAVTKEAITTQTPAITSKAVVENVASKAGVSEIRAKDVLSRISSEQVSDVKKVTEVSRQTGVSEEKVRQIATSADQIWHSTYADHAQIVNQVSKETSVSEAKTRDILSKVTTSEVASEEKVRQISQETGVSAEKVREVVHSAENVKERRAVVQQTDVIERTASESKVSTTTVKEVLSNISQSELTDTDKVREVAKRTGVSEEKVKETVQTAERVTQDKSRSEQEELIKKVSSKQTVTTSTVKQIMSSISEEQLSNEEKVKEVAAKVGVSEDKVKDVVKSVELEKKVKKVEVPVAATDEMVEKLSKMTNVSKTTVRQIVSGISEEELTDVEKVRQIEKATGVSSEKIKEVLKTQKTEQQAAGIAPTAAVSVEDYEEVKSMWLKHYRSAPVPVSGTIKDRNDWLLDEEKKLTNITNLLSSVNPQLKQQGLEKVAEILPFMLLGGFSEAEILTYIKAKLEADRQVMDEAKLEEKAKEKAKKELKEEEEETLVEVKEKKKEEKAEELSAEQVIDNKKPESEEKDKIK